MFITYKGYRSTKSSILFTGGTIASGSAYGALDDTQYGQLSQTGEQIIAHNSYLLNNTQLAVSNWTTEDDGSTGTNDALVMNMTRFARDALCSEDSDIAGAVYTHGTNSLEETAFLMDSLVNCGKPIVGTGSMRPFTHLSYDGDANFFDAVMLAASPESRNRGVMVAFNARIIPGYWATKLHSTNPDASCLLQHAVSATLQALFRTRHGLSTRFVSCSAQGRYSLRSSRVRRQASPERTV
jgi:L-asparaginase